MSYNDRNYVPPAYTPLQNDPQHPPVPPSQQGYPQYSPYPPQEQQPPHHDYQQQQQGYPQYAQHPHEQYGQPAAVVVGVTGDEKHQDRIVEQLNRLPRRMWLAITGPTISNYSGLKMYSSVEMTFFMLLLVVLWSILLELIGFSLVGEKGVGMAILTSIIGTLIFFFLANLLLVQLFVQLCFLSLLFELPLDILGLLTFIPFIGGVIALALFIYKIVLTVITLQAIYGLQTCHAIGVLVLALLVILICFWTLVSYSYMLVLLRAA